MKTALDAAADQVADPSSDLYGHRLQLKSATASGGTNWLVRLVDRTSGKVICVSVATTPGAVTPSTNVAFSSCGSSDAPRADVARPEVAQRGDLHDVAGLRSVDHLATADVDPDMAEPVEEDEVARL